MTPDRTPEETVRFLIRRLALSVTREGTIEAFAAHHGTHPNTVHAWMRKGYVPRESALGLQERYGIELAPAEQLCFPNAQL